MWWIVVRLNFGYVVDCCSNLDGWYPIPKSLSIISLIPFLKHDWQQVAEDFQ